MPLNRVPLCSRVGSWTQHQTRTEKLLVLPRSSTKEVRHKNGSPHVFQPVICFGVGSTLNRSSMYASTICDSSKPLFPFVSEYQQDIRVKGSANTLIRLGLAREQTQTRTGCIGIACRFIESAKRPITTNVVESRNKLLQESCSNCPQFSASRHLVLASWFYS